MDEIEYKLNTNNSILVVNGIDKLITTIKSKYKPIEKQKFLLENEELKFLREKCSSKDMLVSLTACQGLLALVELGVLEIAYTMSTVVILLPSTHNYSAIISTMAGLLILDLKSRLIPGQVYKCQFNMKSPQHPFITVLEKNKEAENEILVQMQALCSHPDYIVSSNSLELLRPVFLWLMCNPQRDAGGIQPWQLLLSLPQTHSQSSLLLACVSCQQISNPKLIESALAAYRVVADWVIYQQHKEYVMALLPMLCRLSTEMLKCSRDPRACYHLIERCFALAAAELTAVAGLSLTLLADNLADSSAMYLHELFHLCLYIISKYEYSSISLNTFVALSLQWLHLPSYLTASALKLASNIVDIYQSNNKEDCRLYMPNVKANKIFQNLLYTDSRLSIVFKLTQTWERVRDNPDVLRNWFDSLESVDASLKLELVPFFMGIIMEKRKNFQEFVLRALRILISLIDKNQQLSVQLLPVLLYKVANDVSPEVKLECLRALPMMAKSKENVPTIVSILNKFKASKGVATSFLIMLYCRLAEAQVRCFPYLKEMLVDASVGRADDLKWEIEIAKAVAVDRICEIRPITQGVDVVPVMSSILNRCGDKPGGAPSAVALGALRRLWAEGAVSLASAWRALQTKLGRDQRPLVQIAICKLLSEVPRLRSSSPEYDKLASDTARRLWCYISESNEPEVIEAACQALSCYNIDDYKLKDIPEIYRKTVKLPAAYCKTPADAARKPEDVLDYVPGVVWPEVFKYTNQSALASVEGLASRLISREIRAYRSGVYRPEVPQEPSDLTYLPAASVVRGLVEFFRKQATCPTYDCPESVLLSILSVLGCEYPKPLPPVDLCFLHEIFHKGAAWKQGCLRLAARQSLLLGSARRLVENYLQTLEPGTSEDADIMFAFELLPILCRGMPPNSLRPPLERCLGHSYDAVSRVRGREAKKQATEYMFVRQLRMMKEALECDKIHDANRTLLSQQIENYFSLITDDNVAWAAFSAACVCLCVDRVERLTSPSGWWEVSPGALRVSAALRCEMSLRAETAPLAWLNDVIDSHAQHYAEQEHSLRCMVKPLKAVDADAASTRQWFLELMARSQVAFNETEDIQTKLYFCDVFMMSAIIFSGHWSFEPDAEHVLSSNREAKQALVPAAVASLAARPAWQEAVPQVVEWLCHSLSRAGGAATALCWQRSLLALRHTPHLASPAVWTRLESHIGQAVSLEE